MGSTKKLIHFISWREWKGGSEGMREEVGREEGGGREAKWMNFFFEKRTSPQANLQILVKQMPSIK